MPAPRTRSKKAPEPLHKVLITIDDDARASIDAIAAQLRKLGLKEVETFSLGPVVVGSARNADLAKMLSVPGISAIEKDSNFFAI